MLPPSSSFSQSQTHSNRQHRHSPMASHLAVVALQPRHRPVVDARQFQLHPARPMSPSHPDTAQQGRRRQQIQKSGQIRHLRRSSANRDTDLEPSTAVFG
ncbi:unnamed protein product [Linum trigynum]|uniref:Uncharacterized protein n=1 Tax=Linum trigynum TaxID=586398 RepID=A0AAV2GIN7_9ROSI